MRTFWLVVLLATSTALHPGAAFASRLATDTEVRAMLVDLGSDPYCAPGVTVSTVDPSWAVFVNGGTECGGAITLDKTLLHFDGAWQARGALGILSPCPLYEEEPRSFEAFLPLTVASDLGVCQPLSVRVLLNDGIGIPIHGRYRPRGLGQGAHGYWTRIRWATWGAESAKATAVFVYADWRHAYRVRVRLEASNMIACGRQRLYGSLRMSPRHRKDRRKLGVLTRPVLNFNCVDDL